MKVWLIHMFCFNTQFTYYTYLIALSFLVLSRLIKEHDCNIFANMQKTDFRDFRNLIIDMVLHTDMSQHFSQLKAMKTMIQQNSGESR